MKKLMRVKRGQPNSFWVEGVRQEPQALVARKAFEFDHDDFVKDCDFFLVEEQDVEALLRHISNQNPGVDVEVYGLEQVGHCPAGEFVSKKVNADGVLPA